MTGVPSLPWFRRGGPIPYGSRIVVLLSVLTCLPGSASAEAQSLTPGAVDLAPTFEAISVRARFFGDGNANATAAVKFRKRGEAVWHDAYPPMIDRRERLGGAVNPYAFEARGSIVGLASNTTYEVQVTWADPDGIAGAQPGVATVTTLSYTPPTGGSTITVTDDASLAVALRSVSPGQTIHLNPGIYKAFTISRSGSSGAWISIEGAASGGSVVSGSGVSQNIAVNGNYIIIQNLTLSASDFNGIVIARGRHHLFIQDNTLQNVSALCANGPTTTHYSDTGILVGHDTSNIYVLRNAIHSPALNNPACIQKTPWHGPGEGIGWTNVTTLVVKNNTVADAFRDAISADSETLGVNVDVTGNTVGGFVDDGIESKGANVNTRLWGNTIIADKADTCIAGNTNSPTIPYGPLYIFRNTCRVTTTNPSGTTVYKIYPGAPMYIFHNSVDSSLANPRWDCYVMGGNGPFVVLNNIAVSSGSMIGRGASATATFDYNLGLVTTNASYAYRWKGTTEYDSFAAFRNGTGQEAHGLNVAPRFLDTGLRIGATSPAVDRGVILPNFNTLDSAWPYSGAAPDIGAFEVETSPARAPQRPSSTHAAGTRR